MTWGLHWEKRKNSKHRARQNQNSAALLTTLPSNVICYCYGQKDAYWFHVICYSFDVFFQSLHIFCKSISELVKLKMSEKLTALNTIIVHSRQLLLFLCCRVLVRVTIPFVAGGMVGRMVCRMGYMPRGAYFLSGGTGFFQIFSQPKQNNNCTCPLIPPSA